jgi:hypothetical protein
MFRDRRRAVCGLPWRSFIPLEDTVVAIHNQPQPNGPEEPRVAPDDELGERENTDQATQAQRPGGGGAPGTGELDSDIPLSLGEGVTEEQLEQAGLEP